MSPRRDVDLVHLLNREKSPTKSNTKSQAPYPTDTSSELQLELHKASNKETGQSTQDRGCLSPLPTLPGRLLPQEPCLAHALVCQVPGHSLVGWSVLPGSAVAQSAELLNVLKRPLVASSTCSASSTCWSFGSLASVSSSSHLGGNSNSYYHVLSPLSAYLAPGPQCHPTDPAVTS